MKILSVQIFVLYKYVRILGLIIIVQYFTNTDTILVFYTALS